MEEEEEGFADLELGSGRRRQWESDVLRYYDSMKIPIHTDITLFQLPGRTGSRENKCSIN